MKTQKTSKKGTLVLINQLVLLCALLGLPTFHLLAVEDQSITPSSGGTVESIQLPKDTKDINKLEKDSTKRIKELGGQILLDAKTEVTRTLQVDKHIEFIGISTPTATPKAGHADLWLSSTTRQLCTKYDDTSVSCLGTGGGGGTGDITSVTAGLGLTGGGTTGDVTLYLSTPISAANLGSSAILNQDSLQAGATYYLSSGTVINLNNKYLYGYGDTGTVNARPITSTKQTGFRFFDANEFTLGFVGADGWWQGNTSSETAIVASRDRINFYTQASKTEIFHASATLSANQLVATDANKGLVSVNFSTTGVAYLASTQTFTGQNTWASPSPSTFTYSLAFGSATVLNYIDFKAQAPNPPSPPSGYTRFHSSTNNGFTRFEQDNEAPTNIVLGRDNVFIAKNTTASQMNPLQPVYVSGSTGNVPNIALAKADSLTTLPAIGVVVDTIAVNGFGQIMGIGVLQNINTNAYTTGTSLWVSSITAGSITSTRPEYPNYMQRLGSVLVQGIGNGSILVDIAPFVGGYDLSNSSATATYLNQTVAASTYLTQANATTLFNTKVNYSSFTATDPIVYNNATGAFSATKISLSTGVIGNLPVNNLNGGSGAAATTFWSGAGTWAVPAGTGIGDAVLAGTQTWTGDNDYLHSPSVPTATLSTQAVNYGQIKYGLQVSSQCYSLTTYTTTAATYQITRSTCTITPTSTSSRIKITVSGATDNLNTAISPIVSIFRGSTDLDPGSNGFVQPGTTATQPNTWPIHITWIDSPATTSATTYSIRLKSSSAGSTVQYGAGVPQILILEEIR